MMASALVRPVVLFFTFSRTEWRGLGHVRGLFDPEYAEALIEAAKAEREAGAS